MADLDDDPDQTPLPAEQVRKTIARLLAGTSYDLILTHGPHGEYTRHRRHVECCRSVVELWKSGGIDTNRLWLFAYEDGGREYLPRVRGDADRRDVLAEDVWLEKRRLIVEPGRSVVADAGWLVTRIVRVQARGHLVADAGMTDLIRPMLYGARHPVRLLRPGAATERRPWTVAGPVCEAGDVLARDVTLGASAGEGALLAIGAAGAYGLAMASGYNGRLRPAQAVIEGAALRLSVRRETLEDVIGRYA